MRILFITSSRVGDAVLSTGLLNHLAQAYPDARVTIACGASAAGLFDNFPTVERIIPMQKMPMSLHWAMLWGKTFYTGWDIILDLRRSMLAYLLPHKKRFAAHKSKQIEHKLVELSRIFGLESVALPKVWPSREHRSRARHLLRRPSVPLVALGATANWRGKQWPAENYARLGKILIADKGPFAGGRLVVMGAEHERYLIKELYESLPEDYYIDLVGKCDLLTAACVIDLCDFFVGNDTGLMHLACTTETPVLALFGPSRDDVYGPWSRHSAVVRTAQNFDEIISDPGFDHRLVRSYMSTLSPHNVYDATLDLIDRIRRDVVTPVPGSASAQPIDITPHLDRNKKSA